MNFIDCSTKLTHLDKAFLFFNKSIVWLQSKFQQWNVVENHISLTCSVFSSTWFVAPC